MWIRSKKVKKRIKELNARILELELELSDVLTKKKQMEIDGRLVSVKCRNEVERVKKEMDWLSEKHEEKIDRCIRLLAWQRESYDALEKLYMDLRGEEGDRNV